MRVTLTAFLILALAGVAQAVVTVTAVEVEITAAAKNPGGTPAGDAALQNAKCWDVTVTSERDLIGAQILTVESDPNLGLFNTGIYNNAFGTDLPPSPGMIGLVPALEFDSYVAMPDGATVIGGTGPLGSAPGDLPIDYGDFTDTGAAVNFAIARITLLGAGEGVANINVTELGPTGAPDQQQFFVVLPEPATMSLLALGGLAVLRRRR